MKNKLAVAMLAATIASVAAVAQQNALPKRDQLENNAGVDLPAYSQTESITQKLPLDLLALNRPGELHGIAITTRDGNELGKIESIARNNSDQSLHVIITTAPGAAAAVKLAELTLTALEYFDPAQSLADQAYVASAFERISQYQTGHSALGSLTNPTELPLTTELDDERAQSETASSDRNVQAQASLRPQDNAREPASESVVAAAQQQYIASGSSIVQLALTHPDALAGKQLIDEKGTTLGEIAHIAKNTNDQQLYAVINRTGETTQAAIKLDALAIGKLGFAGDIQAFLNQKFAESEFTPLGGQ